MRTEQEMFDLILDIAKNDERIRAVYMTGSRVNPNAVKDIFQDYDIEYVVKETKSFREDKSWIVHFGERLYMQYLKVIRFSEVMLRIATHGLSSLQMAIALI